MNEKFSALLNRASEQSEQAEIYTVSGSQRLVQYSPDKTESNQVSFIQGISLRLIKNQRLGFAYSNFPDDSLINMAVAMSPYSPLIKYDFPSKIPLSKVHVSDGHLVNISDDFKMIGEFIRTYNHRIYVEFRSMLVDISLFNSKGLSINYEKTAYHMSIIHPKNFVRSYTSCKRQDISLGDISSYLHKLISLPEVDKLPSYESVLISCPVVEQIGISLLKQLQLFGNQLDPNLLVYDDGTIDWLVTSAPFDDEGIVIVDLKQSVVNGLPPTGNSHRTYSSLPVLRHRKIVLEKERGEILNSLDMISKGIWIQQADKIVTKEPGYLTLSVPWVLLINKGEVVGKLGAFDVTLDFTGKIPFFIGSEIKSSYCDTGKEFIFFPLISTKF